MAREFLYELAETNNGSEFIVYETTILAVREEV